SRRTYFDLGQIVAIVAFVFSWGVILGGASNWIAETSPLQHAKMRGREDHFQVAVLTICCAAVQTLLAALCLLSVTAALVTLTFPGLGDILQFFLRYSWYQQTEWYDRQTLKPIGKWDAWVLHIRDLQLLHGFQVRLDGQVQEDGFITLQFYSTDDPFNVVATRTVPVRAIFQKNLNPLEGDNISLNISSWRSVVMANVMYQQQNGSYSQRVASAMWDPWTKPLLEKCFSNAAICDPDIGKGTGGKFKLWDFQDLMDDGLPKEGCYLETRVNLTPFNGLLSMQMTHLGPKPVLDERDDPSDQPSKELFLGDTIPSETIGFERRAQLDHQAAPTLSHHSAGAVASISGFATLDKLGIGGVDVELSDPGQQPKRYGENQGKQLGPFALEPSEWVVAVHQQLREAHPSNFGKALAFLTSAGHVFRLQSEAAIELQHLAAPRGFQIRRLNFEGSTLKDLTLAPVDGRGLARISWTLGEDVETDDGEQRKVMDMCGQLDPTACVRSVVEKLLGYITLFDDFDQLFQDWPKGQSSSLQESKAGQARAGGAIAMRALPRAAALARLLPLAVAAPLPLASLAEELRTPCKSSAHAVPEAEPASQEEVEEVLSRNKTILFMKGTPDKPRCRFSRAAVEILREHQVDFDYVDVLEWPALRLALHSRWPTFPQLYSEGVLLGGSDQLRELSREGELLDALRSSTGREKAALALVLAG
ncbi:unnamed protein product, partial [Effrenium voratum]